MHADGRRQERRSRECQRAAALLPALPDGELRPSDARFVEAHLAECEACRREAQAFAGLGRLLRLSTPDAALPNGETAAGWIIETAQQRSRQEGWTGLVASSIGPRPAGHRSLAAKLALAVAVAGSVVGLALAPGLSPFAPAPSSWSVARLAGTPRSGSMPLHGSGRLKAGQWLETDQASRARLDVADIGQVVVEPSTRLRLVRTRSTEHRLALDRGRMRAQITAPPRLFFVETPSAVAVDMGCAYTLHVDDAGRGYLRVTAGWVALVRDSRESFVPEGARCETRPGVGPGTPFLEDATPALREALAAFDFEGGGAEALTIVLAAAREPDSLTLWHLLSRTSSVERGQVHDRLAALSPPPEGVTREGVMSLNKEMLARWREQIESDYWSQGLGPVW